VRAPRTNEAELAAAFAAALAAAVDARLDELVAERVAGAPPDTAPAQLDGSLSVAEVAEFVGVSKRTVHRALRSRALVGHRTGGAGTRWHIRPDAVTAWLEPQPAPSPRSAVPVAPARAPRATTASRRSFAERARSTATR
jgi:excisionase family DNA binding protein